MQATLSLADQVASSRRWQGLEYQVGATSSRFGRALHVRRKVERVRPRARRAPRRFCLACAPADSGNATKAWRQRNAEELRARIRARYHAAGDKERARARAAYARRQAAKESSNAKPPSRRAGR